MVNGFAHITGDGIENIDRIVDNYVLDDWEFPEIFQKVQKLLKMPREEMLVTFNCGFGMVAVVPQENLDKIDVAYTVIGEVR